MITRHLAAEVATRPALLRWQDSGVTRFAIGIRWTAWLAAGWWPTTLALIALLVLLAWHAPVFVALAAIAGVSVPARLRKTGPILTTVGALAAAIWWTWTQTSPISQAALVALAAVWPADAIAATIWRRHRLRRWWCSLRRGFPVRYAIMAAKATQIQGFVGGERQLIDGRRPIVDHPAIARRPTFSGDTAWALCTVPPGRNAQAMSDVLEELAASYSYVQRMEIVFVDGHQTYGWLVVTFGPPLISSAAPLRTPRPATAPVVHLATAARPAAAALAVMAMTWTVIT